MDVIDRVREHYDMAKTLVPEERIIGVFLYGSQNYGMDSATSDVDTKCLIVPSFEEIAFNKKAVSYEYHFDNGEHMKMVDIREYLRLVKQQNPNDLEILFSKFAVCNTRYNGIWHYLCSRREEIAHYRPHRAMDTMRHMANREMHQMEKRGFNTKSLALIFRLEKMASDYLLCERYEYALYSDQADFLKRVKYGEFVAPDDTKTGMRLMRDSIERLNRLVDRYLEKTEDKPDEEVEKLLKKVAKDFIAKSVGCEIRKWEDRNENETSD